MFGYDRVDDVVVVYDDVESSDAAFRKRWLLHTVERPDGQRRSLHRDDPAPRRAQGHGGGRLEGYVLLPERTC